ncbi:MAG: SET domain-containing protein-lysine N-methyltransferase [Alphaproteobacteria bacterium]
MLLFPTTLKPSPIHGFGVFLLAPVKKGEVIWRFDERIDRVYSAQDFNALPEVAQKFVTTYGTWLASKDEWVVSGDNARFFNHSDKPTTVSLGIAYADDIAAYDLPTGTELTSDYKTICDKTLQTGEL